MPLTRREKQGYATGLIGTGLVYGGAQTAERGVQSGLKLAGLPHKEGRPAFPGLRAMKETRKLKGAGKARALYAGGNAMRTVGAIGALTGAADVYRGRKWRKDNPNNKIVKGFIREGIKGNVEASREKLGNLTEKKPAGAIAIPTSIGIGGAWAGSQAVHSTLNRSRLKGSGKRAGLTALGGLAGAAASTKVSNEALKRTYPEYKLTPTGVQRRKTPPVRPSSQAAVYNEKEGRGAFRRAIVGKADLTDRQKRATIYAAGSVPVVGDFAAAGTARRLAPEGQKNKAYATQLTGNLGGSVVGGLAGAAVAGEAARKFPTVNTKLGSANTWVNDKKKAALKPITDRLPKREVKPNASGAAASTWRQVKATPGKLVPTAVKNRYGAVGGAVALGGLVGQMAGGQTGGFKATTMNLNREKKMVAKALIEINAKPKYTTTLGEDKKAIRQRKKLLIANTVGSGIGAAGLGTFLASRGKVKPATKQTLERATVGLGAVGGGIGSYGGFKRVKVEHGDLRQQEKNYDQRRKDTFGKIDISPLTYANGLLLHAGRGGVRREVARSFLFGPPKELHAAYGITKKPKKKIRLPIQRQAAVAKAMPNILSVPRPLGTLRRPTMRDSALVTRRGRGGTLMTTRRKASLG